MSTISHIEGDLGVLVARVSVKPGLTFEQFATSVSRDKRIVPPPNVQIAGNSLGQADAEMLGDPELSEVRVWHPFARYKAAYTLGCALIPKGTDGAGYLATGFHFGFQGPSEYSGGNISGLYSVSSIDETTEMTLLATGQASEELLQASADTFLASTGLRRVTFNPELEQEFRAGLGKVHAYLTKHDGLCGRLFTYGALFHEEVGEKTTEVTVI